MSHHLGESAFQESKPNYGKYLYGGKILDIHLMRDKSLHRKRGKMQRRRMDIFAPIARSKITLLRIVIDCSNIHLISSLPNLRGTLLE